MSLTGELRQLLDHDGAGGHVDAQRERLGGEHDLHETLDEAGFDRLFERRYETGVVWGDPGLEPREPTGVAEHGEVGVVDAAQSSTRRFHGCDRARPPW